MTHSLDDLFAAAIKAPVVERNKANRHSTDHLSVALAPKGVSVRFDKEDIACSDADIAPWTAFRDAIAAAWPASVWPVGFTLTRSGFSSEWTPNEIYLFGHQIYSPTKAMGVNMSNANRYNAPPVGFDIATAELRALHALFPLSNQMERAFSEGHNMMGTGYVSSRRVIARTEIEAMLKNAWLRDGMDGVQDLIEAGDNESRRHITWFVASEIASYDTDGFASPTTGDVLLNQLRAHMAALANPDI